MLKDCKTKVVTANADGISQTVQCLKEGKVICFKTDTIYGFSCDATNEEACKRILEIKGRDGKPMILLAKNKEVVLKYVQNVSPKAKLIMSQFWPGALTMILPAKDGFSQFVTAGKTTLGFRVPNDDLCQRILSKLNVPIVSTSANISGQPILNSATEILQTFENKFDLLVDCGVCQNSQPSTIIDADMPIYPHCLYRI